jgi:hypothetical protein
LLCLTLLNLNFRSSLNNTQKALLRDCFKLLAKVGMSAGGTTIKNDSTFTNIIISPLITMAFEVMLINTIIPSKNIINLLLVLVENCKLVNSA